MEEIRPDEGFVYDDGKARAMADALEPQLLTARHYGALAAEQLAAVGVLAARVIRDTTLRRDPRKALTRLAAVVQEELGSLEPTRKLP